MREFEYNFDEGLRVGLRPSEANPINSQALIELRNARPTKLGLVPYEPVTLPYDSVQEFWIIDHVVDWPFPQVWFGKGHHLVGTRSRLYRVDDLGRLHMLLMFHSDEPWSMADFGDYMVFARDGTRMVTRSITGVYNADDADVPRCESVADLNGQLFLGNLRPWGDWTDVGESHVGWGDIGSANFEISRRNQAGFRRMDWRGEVIGITSFEGTILAHGHNGLGVLRPSMEPIPTFSYRIAQDVGAAHKSSMSHCRSAHVFLGTDGNIYRMSKEFNIYNLDYREFMYQLTEGVVVVSYNASTGDFFFCDGSRCFGLSLSGLYEVYQRISTLTYYNGTAFGVSSDSEDTEFRLVTDRMDFGLRTNKTVESVEVGCSGTGPFYAAVDWRLNTSDEFQRTPWVLLNNEGVASIRAYGTEFRLCLKSPTFEDVSVSYLKVRYKMSDLRSIRGVYAPPPRGQFRNAGEAAT